MYGSSQSRSACSWNTSPTASPAPSPKAATPPPPRSRKPQTPSPAWHGCAWSSPAPQALGPEAAATTLAGRPYKLRHAALSLWLNAGAAPAQIARRAGHCTTMLVAVYTHCIDAQDVITNRQIERALHPRNRAHHHITGGSLTAGTAPILSGIGPCMAHTRALGRYIANPCAAAARTPRYDDRRSFPQLKAHQLVSGSRREQARGPAGSGPRMAHSRQQAVCGTAPSQRYSR